MKKWKITSLFFGSLNVPKCLATPGVDTDLVFESPYIGYLLQNGEENILVDTGDRKSVV